MNNQFFKPTPLYKEFMVLDLISKDSNITQRAISEKLGISVSMVNMYLDECESTGYLRKNFINSKTVHYIITKIGNKRKEILNIHYLEASLLIHSSAKENIVTFLKQIIFRGLKTIVLYGAGEVAEIMLQVISNDNQIPLKAIAIIDDDPNKQGQTIVNIPIIKKDDLFKYEHDGILISSYTHNKRIFEQLQSMNYDREKIINFFE